MYNYGTISDIAKALIAISFLVVMVDQATRFLQSVMVKIPKLPNEFEPPITYMILMFLSYSICWQGHFDFFTLCGLHWWQNPWIGWTLTGGIIASGSSLLQRQFKMVGLIPSIVSGIASTFGWNTSTETTTEITQEELNQSD